MAISKNSRRVQFTLNADKPKEKEMIEFLDGCFNPNVAIKEIIFNHIVSNCEYKLQQVPQSEVLQNHSKSLQVSNSDDKLVEVSNGEEKLHEVSEIEQNEIEELNKFL